MDVALVIAAGSLLVSCAVAVRGEVRARRAERRADLADQRVDRADERAQRIERRALEAQERAEGLRLDAHWSKLVGALHNQLGLILPSDELEKLNREIRFSATELCDNLPRDEWPDLDKWLAAEHRLGSRLAREVLHRLGPGPATADHVMAAHDDFRQWALAMMNNVRLLRRHGSSDDTKTAIGKLVRNAEQASEQVRQRNGWEDANMQSFRPLD